MIVVDKSCELTKDLEIRFSSLVHDLGKGTTPLEILPHHYGHEDRGEKLVVEFGSRIGVPKSWIKCGKVSAKWHMKGGKFNEMTPKKQVEFIEKVGDTLLGLDGMKIVVMCDKYRNGKYPEDIVFDKIGKECIKEINGRYIMEKYDLKEGIRIKEKLHQERINYIKNKV